VLSALLVMRFSVHKKTSRMRKKKILDVVI